MMYKALSPGAINVTARSLDEAIAAAKIGGFAGVEINPDEIASRGVGNAQEALEASGIVAAAWGLPVDWRTTEENWKAGLAKLPEQAAAAAAVGCRRCATWVLPMSNDRPLEENIPWHIARFGPIAEILGENGCDLGLEFIGPKTLRDQGKYPFVHTMDGMLDLGKAIGPNVGLLLDCWHWYTSGGTVAQIEALNPRSVVYVHVNDAPAGVAVDEQADNLRALPGETGVIDIAGFLGALAKIGYDGPVTPEPFKDDLKNLGSDEARLIKVGQAMDAIFATL